MHVVRKLAVCRCFVNKMLIPPSSVCQLNGLFDRFIYAMYHVLVHVPYKAETLDTEATNTNGIYLAEPEF